MIENYEVSQNWLDYGSLEALLIVVITFISMPTIVVMQLLKKKNDKRGITTGFRAWVPFTGILVSIVFMVVSILIVML